MICQWVFNIRAPSNKNATFAYCFSQKKQPPATIFSQNLPLLNRFTPSKMVCFFFTPRLSGKNAWPQRTSSEQKMPMEKWIAIWLQENLILISFRSNIDILLYNYIYHNYYNYYLDLFLAMKHMSISTEFFFAVEKNHGSDPFNVWWCWKTFFQIQSKMSKISQLSWILSRKNPCRECRKCRNYHGFKLALHEGSSIPPPKQKTCIQFISFIP